MTIGSKNWDITEGWVGDETVGFLNFSSEEVHIVIMICSSPRDPVASYCLIVPARRLRRFRFGCLKYPKRITGATHGSRTIGSDVPTVVEHLGTRVNTSFMHRPEIVKWLQSPHGPLWRSVLNRKQE